MTKDELIKKIAEETETPAVVVSRVLDGLASAAWDCLADDGELTIPGIAKLKTNKRAARQARNPRTGEAVSVPAKTVVSIKPVKALADHVA